jgi:phosphoribosylglycinamide formyltransferase-1
MKNIAIFASGEGSNAENIIRAFKQDSDVKVALVITNRPDAGVINRCKKEGVPCFVFPKHNFTEPDLLIDFLIQNNIDLVVLAGFLLQVPKALIKEFPKKIVNIHPALLPKFGGKGMYGTAVHKAVLEKGETESGISIHYVTENYDEGEIILQETCPVIPGESPESLAGRVQQLEHQHFPNILKKIALS